MLLFFPENICFLFSPPLPWWITVSELHWWWWRLFTSRQARAQLRVNILRVDSPNSDQLFWNWKLRVWLHRVSQLSQFRVKIRVCWTCFLKQAQRFEHENKNVLFFSCFHNLLSKLIVAQWIRKLFLLEAFMVQQIVGSNPTLYVCSEECASHSGSSDRAVVQRWSQVTVIHAGYSPGFSVKGHQFKRVSDWRCLFFCLPRLFSHCESQQREDNLFFKIWKCINNNVYNPSVVFFF